jgi:hypothetical protein
MFPLKAVKSCRLLGLVPAFMTCWLLACSGGANRDGGTSDLGAQGGAAAVPSEGGAPVSTRDGALPAGTLRFDGLYQHPVQGYTTFLRFYQGKTEQSGTVYEVSATETAQQVATWLKKDSSKSFQKGQYELEGSSISFLVSDDTAKGRVEFQGDVGVDQLVLQVHSLATDYLATETYTFVPLDLP